MEKVTALILVFVLFGCAGMMNVKTTQAVVENTIIEADDFKKIRWLKAPEMKASTVTEAAKKDKSDWQVDLYFLRAMKDDKSKTEVIQIYISHEDTGWIFFDQAIDRDGKELEFTSINREASQYTKYGAGVREDFTIKVDMDYLTTKLNDGILIKVYGKQGKRTLKIPGYYIQGFVDRYREF